MTSLIARSIRRNDNILGLTLKKMYLPPIPFASNSIFVSSTWSGGAFEGGGGGGGGVNLVDGEDDEEEADPELFLSDFTFLELFEDDEFGESFGGDGVTSSCLISVCEANTVLKSYQIDQDINMHKI